MLNDGDEKRWVRRRNMTRNLFALKSCYGKTDGIDTETNVCCWSNFNLYINPRSVSFQESRKVNHSLAEAKFSRAFLVMCATCFNLWLSAIHYEYLMIFLVRSSVEHFYLTRLSLISVRIHLRNAMCQMRTYKIELINDRYNRYHLWYVPVEKQRSFCLDNNMKLFKLSLIT